MAKVECPNCSWEVTVTKGGIIYRHSIDDELCAASGQPAWIYWVDLAYADSEVDE